MSRSRTSVDADAPSAASAARAAGVAGIAERLLFFAIVGLLACRLLVSESFERVQASFLAGASVGGPTPATTALLDCVTLLFSATAIALRPPLIERGYSWTMGIGLLLVAIASSTALAGEKQVAALAGANMFVLIVAGIALAGVAREAWMPRLIVAVVLACAGMNAVKCFQQVGYEFDDTARFWRETQRPQLEQRGADLTDPMIVDYERRLASQNAFGMLAHPNVAASIMAAGAVLALAACGRVLSVRSAPRELGGRALGDRSPTGLSPLRDRFVTGLPSLWDRFVTGLPAILTGINLALAALIGVLTTGSNGALLAALIAAALLVATWFAITRQYIRPGLVIGGYVGGLLLLFGFGLARGTLPGASLAFRWEYWTAGLRSWLDAPLIGVGRMNFVSAYLRYRAESATEEVKDPHNLWITMLVELGPIGLLAGILLLTALVRSLLAGTGALVSDQSFLSQESESKRDRSETGPPAQPHLHAVPRWAIFGTALGVIALQAIASGYPLLDANVALLWAFEFAAVWVVLLLVALVAVDAIADDPQRLRYACLAALACLLIHNWVDFSLAAVPGMAMASLLAAAALAPRAAQFESAAPRIAISWSVVGVVLVALHAWAVALPLRAIDEAYRTLGSLRQPLTNETARSLHALAANPWDSDTPGTIAATLMAHARLSDPPSAGLLEEARVFAQRCVAFNPRSAANWALLARVLDAQVAITEQGQAIVLARRATEAWQHAIDLYPTNPRAHLSIATAHATLLRLDPSATDGAIVRYHIDTARRIDNSRDPRVAARLRPEELAQLSKLEAEVSTTQPTP
ncbi:MAG: O-antigen ligase family protein [Phycisphaerae bacterium]